MSIRVDIKRSYFFNELTDREQKKYFDLVEKKYVHNIDNIYYSVHILGDDKENEQVNRLINELKELKNLMLMSFEEVPYKFGLVYENKRHATYALCLTNKERYDIYFDEVFRNENTPRILVKIRSMPLWVENLTDVVIETFNTLSNILKEFDLEVFKVRENRLDYAFHTNMIQNPRKHFSDKNLEDTMKTTMTSYSITGKIKSQHNQTMLTKDYVAFGNRKSNNVFIRMYNKTREVIEQGYKAYFIHFWYNCKLISFYDKYCLEFAYEHKNYDKIHLARLRFYLQYGKNNLAKEQIYELLKDKETTLQDIEHHADQLMPKVTIINNIEFETKRKFYYYSDKHIDKLSINDYSKMSDSRLHRIFKIIDNRTMFLNYITENILKFEKNSKICDWWKRLKHTKIKTVCKRTDKIAREYNKNLNEKIVKRKLVNNVATLGVYNRSTEKSFVEDLADVLSNINDNHTRYDIVDEFGCLDEQIKSKLLEDYKQIKDKKNRLLKNRLKND